MNSYFKIYTGPEIIVLSVKNILEQNYIIPIIKDQSESARLAGFGSAIPYLQDVFVHEDEKINAIDLIKEFTKSNNT